MFRQDCYRHELCDTVCVLTNDWNLKTRLSNSVLVKYPSASGSFACLRRESIRDTLAISPHNCKIFISIIWAWAIPGSISTIVTFSELLEFKSGFRIFQCRPRNLTCRFGEPRLEVWFPYGTEIDPWPECLDSITFSVVCQQEKILCALLESNDKNQFPLWGDLASFAYQMLSQFDSGS